MLHARRSTRLDRTPGPGARRHPEGHRATPSSRSAGRRRSTCRATGRRGKGHPLQIQEAARAIARAKKPVLYVGRRHRSTPRRRGELLALAEETRIPVVTTLLAKGAFPDSHPLSLQMPGMHGSKFANWALHRSDLLITVGRALRRSRDRQAGRVRARRARSSTWTSTRRRSPRTATPTSRSWASCARCCRSSRRRSRSCASPTRSFNHRAWLEQVEEWRSSTRSAIAAAGRSSREYVIERLRDLLADRDVDLDDGRRPAPDVGRPVAADRRAAGASSPPAASARWASASPPRIGAKLGRPEATVV